MRLATRGFAVLVITLSLLAGCGAAAAEPTPQRVTTTAQTCNRACWLAVIERQRNERLWWAEVVKQQQARAAYLRLLRFAAAVDAAKRAEAGPSGYRPGQCGGSLPPCYVMMRESRGNIHAQNPRSTASGKWQFLDSTWGRHRGYAKARYAPEWVQDEKARILWAGGRGCSHWLACR